MSFSNLIFFASLPKQLLKPQLFHHKKSRIEFKFAAAPKLQWTKSSQFCHRKHHVAHSAIMGREKREHEDTEGSCPVKRVRGDQQSKEKF